MSNLYIVPTPIGNLKDITLRAIEVLNEADLILSEDTRTTQNLLKHFDISTKTRAYHQHNEHVATKGVIEELLSKELNYALVSDAGTPGISDPGFLLIRACVKEKINVVSLPGPTAFVPAITKSGFPCDRFVFEGFLPHKKGRAKRLTAIKKKKEQLYFMSLPIEYYDSLKKQMSY